MVKILLAFSMMLFLVSCYDRFYGPKIRNGFEHEVTIDIEYENGETQSSIWAPCETAFIGKKGNAIQRVLVLHKETVLYDFEQAGLSELLKKGEGKTGYFVWRIGPEGVVPDTRQDCEKE